MATIDSSGKANYYFFGKESIAGSPIGENSVFELASISKTFTSTLIHQLVKEGMLNWDQEMRAFLPDSLPETIQQITVQQLVNHTSGLPRLAEDFWPENWSNPYMDYDKTQFYSDLMNIDLDSVGKWQYSNLGYALLGCMLEELTDKKGMASLISTLGLQNTSAEVSFRPTIYPHNFGINVEVWDFPGFNQYMGGVRSTATDLTQYLRYQIKNNPSFSSTYQEKDVAAVEADSLYCRNGWLVFRRNQESIIWHNGISGGSNSFIGYHIESKRGVVILSNAQRSILDLGLHYLSNDFEIKTPKPSLTVEVQRLIEESEWDRIEDTWNHPDTLLYDKNIMDLYWLQCDYMHEKTASIALLLNDLLLADLPDDRELLYHRGKIYEIRGDLKEAQKWYDRMNEQTHTD
ncbi:beta-lactamase family protein [bacterium SCSIO 12741]|nr:beta-lactamase family protein [bacterium SCSIO 12741]